MAKPLTTAEQDQLASLLQRAEWPLPPAVFNATRGLMPSVAVELVVLSAPPMDDFSFSGQKEIVALLFPRPEDDQFFGGLVHSPDTIMRRGDTGASVFARLMSGELGGPDNFTTPVFVGVKHTAMGPLPNCCPRGQEIGLVYYCLLKEGKPWPPGIQLATEDTFPENIIGYHKPMIKMAIEKYTSDIFGSRKKK